MFLQVLTGAMCVCVGGMQSGKMDRSYQEAQYNIDSGAWRAVRCCNLPVRPLPVRPHTRWRNFSRWRLCTGHKKSLTTGVEDTPLVYSNVRTHTSCAQCPFDHRETIANTV